MTKAQLLELLAIQDAALASKCRLIAALERQIATLEVGQATLERAVVTYHEVLVTLGLPAPPLPDHVQWVKQTPN